MAKAGKIPYVDAISSIALPKTWAGASLIRWKSTGGKGSPAAHKCRIPLSVNNVVQEGLFVDLFYKYSGIAGLPDKVCMAFVAHNARLMALDENGPSQHVNVVGKQMPFYGKVADHPHLHFPVEEASSGYAEPIDRQAIGQLWRLFLERANINEAPTFTLPPKGPQQDESGQMDLL
ncbi:hypothetical protein [Pseudomonas sp. SLFW]|uniref:hypothetical protein n=1 Tax=Pseudomonas sp. SLFW TaxID=2683259 RepID=UPI0014129B1B|nr:hypothetical protein [Pseudomonas sp. SLFW]NBB11792.1 hypothetical protein [Pseudomonas sp. SLFW]